MALPCPAPLSHLVHSGGQDTVIDLGAVGTHVRDLIIALERAAGLPTSTGFVANPLGVHA